MFFRRASCFESIERHSHLNVCPTPESTAMCTHFSRDDCRKARPRSESCTQSLHQRSSTARLTAAPVASASLCCRSPSRLRLGRLFPTLTPANMSSAPRLLVSRDTVYRYFIKEPLQSNSTCSCSAPRAHGCRPTAPRWTYGQRFHSGAEISSQYTVDFQAARPRQPAYRGCHPRANYEASISTYVNYTHFAVTLSLCSLLPSSLTHRGLPFRRQL